jgi:hypothetical protein
VHPDLRCSCLAGFRSLGKLQQVSGFYSINYLRTVLISSRFQALLPLSVLLLLQVSTRPVQPIKITGEQAALLKNEAQAVRKRTTTARQTLEEIDAEKQFAQARDTLRSIVVVASDDIGQVSARFNRLAPGAYQSRAAEIYFGHRETVCSVTNELHGSRARRIHAFSRIGLSNIRGECSRV